MTEEHRHRNGVAVAVRRSPVHGKGLFARRQVAEGQYIGSYEGPMTERDGTHVLWIEGDDEKIRGIDGRNALRYLNHDDEPNAAFDGNRLFALRRIRPGEEIFIDYDHDWDDED